MKSGNFTVNEIEFKLKQYCSYQDRCHNEVEKKLKTFDVISEVKEQIISNLISENYLNETRFCKSFVRGKFKIKNWTPWIPNCVCGRVTWMHECSYLYVND